MTQQVFVTGYAALTAAGDASTTWDAINKQQSHIAPVTYWDGSAWENSLVGEIKDYNPRTLLSNRKLLKVISRYDVLGLNVVKQVVDHSEILTYRDSLSDANAFNEKTGVFVGSPGNNYCQQYPYMPLLAKAQRDTTRFADHLFEEVHPMILLKILPNNVLAYTGVEYGFKGVNQNITHHAVSACQAIMEAYYAIQTGQIDRAVVVAYDSPIEALKLFYYGGVGLLSDSAIRPFSADRNGTILGEGAGAFIIESKRSAEERKAQCYAEILSGATHSEAKGMFALDEDGATLARTMQTAIEKAKINANDVGMVTAHANGTPQSDATEAQAIRTVFGDVKIPVTGFKWCFGHTIAAAGAIEAVMTIQSLNEQVVPGIATTEQCADDCVPLNISQDQQQLEKPVALINSRGIAGGNASLLLKCSL